MATTIHMKSVTKRYGDVHALEDVTLSVPPAGITAILGPSGSGKTTLLNVCAGVVAPSSGRVFIGNDDVTEWPMETRDIGIVFQGYCLFPHLSVVENVAFPLRTKRHRVSREIAVRRASAMLEVVGLRGYENRRPSELSGGQQQRVALARALVFGPQLLLLDEPLAALDAALKEQLQLDIKRVRDELGVAILYVTHNVTEALVLADSLAILHQGRLVQTGSPRALYERPVNAIAAAFVGEANFIHGTVRAVDHEMIAIDTEGASIRAPRAAVDGFDHAVTVMVRPEKIQVASTEAMESGDNTLCGAVRAVAFLGSLTRLSIELAPGIEWRVYVQSDGHAFSPMQRVQLRWHVADTVVLDVPKSEVGIHGLAEPVNAVADQIA